MWLSIVFLWLEQEVRALPEDVCAQFHRLVDAQALQITCSGEAAQDPVSDSLMALMKKRSFARLSMERIARQRCHSSEAHRPHPAQSAQTGAGG